MSYSRDVQAEGKITHVCDYSNWNTFMINSRAHGDAANECYEDEKGLWITNGEYANQVNYCPFCGYKADTQYPAITYRNKNVPTT